MIVTEQEIRKLVRVKGHTTPATYEDAVQEALLAAHLAEQEKPDNKQFAIGRAITAARNFTRKERARGRHEGGGEFCQGLDIHDEEVANQLIAPVPDFSPAQVDALHAFVEEQDEPTREIMAAILAGDSMMRISNRTGRSHSDVCRIVRRFKEAASRELEGVE